MRLVSGCHARCSNLALKSWFCVSTRAFCGSEPEAAPLAAGFFALLPRLSPNLLGVCSKQYTDQRRRRQHPASSLPQAATHCQHKHRGSKRPYRLVAHKPSIAHKRMQEAVIYSTCIAPTHCLRVVLQGQCNALF